MAHFAAPVFACDIQQLVHSVNLFKNFPSISTTRQHTYFHLKRLKPSQNRKYRLQLQSPPLFIISAILNNFLCKADLTAGQIIKGWLVFQNVTFFG
jgi:hypothetical protein